MKHIHISVEDIDHPSGFTGTDCIVYIDGKVDGSVLEVDTEAGWVRCIQMEDLGEGYYHVLFDEDGFPLEVIKYGKITVEAVDEYGNREWFGVEE